MAKKTPTIKKTPLDFEYDWDFLLIGIVSAARDYQLCWSLNKHLGIQLVKQKDIELNLKKKNKLVAFCHFRVDDELEKCEYHLLGNKFLGELLIPEYKMVDYFLKVKGFSGGERKDKLISKLKELHLITKVMEIDVEGVKSRENLILD
jgi:hypothetical protein